MKNPVYLWFNELLAQAIEGASDSFLIVVGGSVIAQTGAATLPAVTLRQVVLSVALGGAIYAASFLKKTPLPSALRAPAVEPAAPATVFSQ